MHTTIRLSQDTVEWLKRLGKKGESYDTIIRKFLNLNKEVGKK